MQRVLFHSTIFGPIHSRRLGTSLGINLTPNDGKICSFDCLYCEAGFNAQGPGTTGFAPVESVAEMLEDKLREMQQQGAALDVITFSGNGEPTLHPHFGAVVDRVLALRDRYYPQARVSVLTNATRLHDDEVVEALRRVDNNILKLDSAVPATMALIDRPVSPSYDIERVIDLLGRFAGTGIIQTMFVNGSSDGTVVDNTTDAEVEALIEAYRRIRPASIMIYSIDRPTPERMLRRVEPERLRALAERISAATGIPVTTA